MELHPPLTSRRNASATQSVVLVTYHEGITAWTAARKDAHPSSHARPNEWRAWVQYDIHT